MTTKLSRKAFTLVELLVVIAIIAILMAAFFPAITGVFDRARATSMKNLGHGVWLAVTSANYEREPLGFGNIWPAATDTDPAQNNTSTKYFKKLMTEDLTEDLKPEMLAGGGVPSAKSKDDFAEANCAWGVTAIGDVTPPAEVPFMWTKNITWSGNKVSSNNTVSLKVSATGAKVPFENRMAVWVSVGGSTYDARRKYATCSQIAPTTNAYDAWYDK